MARTYGVGIVGLGVIGRRMLDNMPEQGRLRVASAWDLDPGAREAAARDYTWLSVAEDADAVIAGPGVDLVYIGVPPGAHGAYARAAIEAGKAVFCEKPLGVDLEESAALTEFAANRGARAAVNLSLAGARGVAHMREALASGAAGAVAGADIRLHFAEWPRAWQASARWLAGRAEGGFVREVGTHFLYLAEALLGPARLVAATAAHPSDGVRAETQALARLDCSGVPVTLAGSVGGAGPDLVEFTLWCERRSFRLTDFYRPWQSDGAAWDPVFPDIENPARDAYMRQLDQLVAMLDGEAHMLPDFAAALSVQRHVEAILAAG